MKKNNKKGFVLAETIVVGVFLMGLLSILILNVLPLIGEYERISKYDNLDRKYDVNLIRKMILMDSNKDQVFANDHMYKGYHMYNVTSFCNMLVENKNYCNNLLSSTYLNVNTLIISKYSISKLKNFVNDQSYDQSRGLREYINYLPENFINDSVTTYAKFENYRKIIVEFNDNTYASIEVPYGEN